MGGRTSVFAMLLVSACGGAAPPPSSAGPAHDDTRSFPVHLHRPSHVGERFAIHVEVTETRTTDAEPERGSPEHSVDVRRLELTADADVLAVDAVGRAEATAYVVRTFEAVVDGRRGPVLAPGARIVVELGENGTPLYRVDDAAADGPLAQALASVVPPPSRGATDDEVFGSPGLHRVGDAWPVNRERIAETLASSGRVTVVPAAVRGEARLEGVTEIAGVTCLDVSVEVLVDPVGFLGLPEGTRFDASTIRLSMRGAFPLEEERRRIAERTRLELSFVAHPPRGDAPATVRFTDVKERVAVVEPLEATP